MTALGSNQQLVIQIVQELSNDDFKVLSPALRAVGNFMSAENNKIAENFLFHGVLDKFDSLLLSSNVNIIKETLWSLSNLAAGTSDNITRLFANERIINRLSILVNNPNIDIKKEALWVISNALTCCDSQTYWEILD